jgi:8-oxo-dGTP diphosphatase
MADAPRKWLVAGALVEAGDGLLMVHNRRRGGFSDWSTPGGVIDADDASLLEGLTREVEEETGIRVRRWEGPVYEVRALAVDLGWSMRCEVHRAIEFDGELRVEDPDGIVVDAAFVPHGDIRALLDECARWVSEPLAEWLAERWGPAEARGYRYEVHGTARADLRVHRTPT